MPIYKAAAGAFATAVTLEQVMALDPAVLAGITLCITDYNGTYATSDGVRWNLGRISTTWVERPAANLVPVNTELCVLDLNNNVFFSDGTKWRPVNGKCVIANRWGKQALPISVLTNITAGSFGQNVLLPAGLLQENSRIVVSVVGRHAAAYTGSFRVALGATGISPADPAMWDLSMSATANQDIRGYNEAVFSGALNSFLTPNWLGVQTSGTDAAADRTIESYSTNDLLVSFNIANGNVADTYSLYGYTVELIA